MLYAFVTLCVTKHALISVAVGLLLGRFFPMSNPIYSIHSHRRCRGSEGHHTIPLRRFVTNRDVAQLFLNRDRQFGHRRSARVWARIDETPQYVRLYQH
jgi:hypothetical protein